MGCGASSQVSDHPNIKVDYDAEDVREFMDEFNENTVTPLPPRDPKDKFKNGRPTIDGGEVTQCFDNGLLFKIIKGDTWAFYNDTRAYEMHIGFTFGERSELTALGNTKITRQSNGELLAETVVYPAETAMYVSGTHAGFTSKIRAMPLSEEYLGKRAAQGREVAKTEKDALLAVADRKGTEEEHLAKCIETNTKFIDLSFFPNQESITRQGERQMKEVPWGRPRTYLSAEYVKRVRLFCSPVVPSNIDQGDLGDCWAMCAIATMAENPKTLRNMFSHPRDPRLTAKEHAVGAYRVALCKDGWWRSVIVDDYLPYIGSRPKFGKSLNDPSELWVSILEKAYAKLHGSYASITAGDPLQALQDMTGYPTTRYDESLEAEAKDGSTSLFDRLERYLSHGFQIIISTPSRDPAQAEQEVKFKAAGLLLDHAYTILKMKYFAEQQVRLVQVRNPWGLGAEWKGEWGDSSEKWTHHPDIARACDHVAAEDGTFWMKWSDVTSFFSGCGVMFAYPQSFTYRIRTTFINTIPSAVLQVTVKEKVSITITMSQKDHRGTAKVNDDYPAVMVSLASGSGSTEVMQVIRNTNLDVDRSTSQFTFMQSREVGMMFELTPEESPYFIIPRIITTEKEVPVVLGLFCDEKIGASNIHVEFREVTEDNQLFRNYPTFAGKSKPTTAEYQVTYPGDLFPSEVVGKELAEKAPPKRIVKVDNKSKSSSSSKKATATG